MTGLSFVLVLAGGYGSPSAARPLSLELGGDLTLAEVARPALFGAIDAEGLARARPIEGRLRLGRVLAYDLSFTGDDGTSWRLEAAQRLALAGKPAAFSVARGYLRAASGPVHPVELRFDPRSDLRRVLASFAFRRG